MWLRLICGISFPPTCQPCSPFCHALISTYRTKCSLPFIRPSRACGLSLGRPGQRLIEAPGDNRKVYGFGLLDWRDCWFDGRLAPGRTSDVFCEQVRAAVARSKQRGRVAIVMTDNLKTHTSAGSLLVRSMRDLRSRSTYPWCIHLPMILMPTALNGSGGSRDGS